MIGLLFPKLATGTHFYNDFVHNANRWYEGSTDVLIMVI